MDTDAEMAEAEEGEAGDMGILRARHGTIKRFRKLCSAAKNGPVLQSMAESYLKVERLAMHDVTNAKSLAEQLEVFAEQGGSGEEGH